MRRPEGIRFEVCALIRLHGDAQGFGADRAAPSWHSVRATRYSGTKRSKAGQIFRSLGRYRRQFHRYLPIPISSAGTDELVPQIARLDLSAKFRLDRPREQGFLRRELACSTTYQ
jgi:hypothetical protein